LLQDLQPACRTENPLPGGGWQKTAEVRRALGEPRPAGGQVLTALEELAEAGLIERLPPWTDGQQPGKTYK